MLILRSFVFRGTDRVYHIWMNIFIHVNILVNSENKHASTTPSNNRNVNQLMTSVHFTVDMDSWLMPSNSATSTSTVVAAAAARRS